ATPCNSGSASTPPPQRRLARPWPAKTSLPTSYGTRPPWHCCAPESTSPSSPCGSATNRSPPRRSTCKPTWRSSSKHSTGPRRPPPPTAATGPPTPPPPPPPPRHPPHPPPPPTAPPLLRPPPPPPHPPRPRT